MKSFNGFGRLQEFIFPYSAFFAFIIHVLFAEIKILGRAAGPLLQDIGTKTAYTQDLSISAAVVPSTGCATGDNYFDAAPTAQYDAIVNTLEGSISANGNAVFRTADSETSDVKTGRYTRQASWIYTSC